MKKQISDRVREITNLRNVLQKILEKFEFSNEDKKKSFKLLSILLKLYFDERYKMGNKLSDDIEFSFSAEKGLRFAWTCIQKRQLSELNGAMKMFDGNYDFSVISEINKIKYKSLGLGIDWLPIKKPVLKIYTFLDNEDRLPKETFQGIKSFFETVGLNINSIPFAEKNIRLICINFNPDGSNTFKVYIRRLDAEKFENEMMERYKIRADFLDLLRIFGIKKYTLLYRFNHKHNPINDAISAKLYMRLNDFYDKIGKGNLGIIRRIKLNLDIIDFPYSSIVSFLGFDLAKNEARIYLHPDLIILNNHRSKTGGMTNCNDVVERQFLSVKPLVTDQWNSYLNRIGPAP